MLVLQREINQTVIVQVGDKIIEVAVVDVRRGNKVRLGFTAERDVIIHRSEVVERIKQRLSNSTNNEVQS